MTARPAAAESFLTLLDDLAGAKAKPSGAAAAVMLAHAATHLRGLLDQVRELEREAEDEAALDEVLAAVRSEIRGQAAASPGGKSRPRNPAWPFTTDAPRPDGPSPVAGSGPGHRDLSHLPPMAGAGQDMCRAESAPHPGFRDRWDCTARRGHPERWHAAHDEETGEPHAALFPDAAWPVAARETGLPPWGAAWRGLGSAPGAGYCGATEGRWTCSAVPDHAPLDHVAFAPWDSRLAGAVLARWPSARPPSFEQMLASPDGQFDPRSELLASIAEFANAPSVTAGTVARAAPGGTATLRPDKCPDHDVNMPHDVRYQGWRSCPPKCPYRLWHERHGLTEPPQSNGHALRPPDCAGCGHPWVTHGLNAPGGPCYGNEGACQCAEYEPPGDVRRDGMGARGEPATGVPLARANTVPPRTDLPRPAETARREPGHAEAGGSEPSGATARQPDGAVCWHAGDHPGLPVWDCGQPLPARGDPENRCNAEKDGLICTAGAGHAPADHAGHGPDGEVIGHWRPDAAGAGSFRPAAPVPAPPSCLFCEAGDPSHPGPDDAEDCRCECHLDEEVTT